MINRERPWIQQMKKSRLWEHVPDTMRSPDAIQTSIQTVTMAVYVLVQLACCPVILMYDPSHSASNKVVRPVWSPDHHSSTDIAVTTHN